MIPIFDGHNDTITRADAAGFVTGRPGGHIDPPRARVGGLGGIFAIFSDTGLCAQLRRRAGNAYRAALAEPIGQDVAAPDATRAAGRLLALERAGHLRIARRATDLDDATRDGVLAAIMHLEGAEAIDPGLEKLELWPPRACARSARSGVARTRSPTAFRSRLRRRRTRARGSRRARSSCAAARSSASPST